MIINTAAAGGGGGGGVKKVQRGTATAAGTITIEEVVMEKTVVHSVSKGSAGTVAATGTLNINGAAVTMEVEPKLASSSTYGIDYICKASTSGSNINYGKDWAAEGSIAAHTGELSGGTTNLIVKEYSAVLTSSTTIKCDGPVEWQVVEYY